MQILHNPRCGKSRETLKIIQAEGVDPEIILYLKETPTKEELKSILSKLDTGAEGIVRKGEAIFKENYKGKTFTEEEWLDILVQNPKLIERPIVIKGNQAIIGRPPENVKKLF
jgi:arsenate reductase